MPQWISAEAWLRDLAEREDAEAARLAAHRDTVKPPWGERGMVERERDRRRTGRRDHAELHGQPVVDVASGGRL